MFQDLDGRTGGSPWRRRGPAGRPSKARAAQSTRSRTTTPTGGRVPPGRLKLTRGSKPPDHNLTSHSQKASPPPRTAPGVQASSLGGPWVGGKGLKKQRHASLMAECQKYQEVPIARPKASLTRHVCESQTDGLPQLQGVGTAWSWSVSAS